MGDNDIAARTSQMPVAQQAKKAASQPIDVEKRDVLDLKPEYFGPIWKYIKDDSITDVDFNGTDLWITDVQNRRIKIQNSGITPEFVNAFSQRVANQVSKPFNKMNNLLEAETETLRISILHETAAVSGRSICLRKSLPTVRMTAASILRDEYMPRPILNLLTNCIESKMNFVIGGEPGAGKTEAAKFFTQFIPPEQRVITIEDSPEWHFREINPGHDCVEMRVNDDFPYAKAIKTCLRQNPKWIMLSEARSVEAKFLIESWSTGVNGVTTIHTDDIRKIPSRLLNMMANRDDADRLENDVYDFVNVAFLVRRKQMLDGTAHRYIDQMGFLYHDDEKNKRIMMLVKNGEMVADEIPNDIRFRLERAGIENPFENADIDRLVGGDPYHYVSLADRERAEEDRRRAEAERKQAEATRAAELEARRRSEAEAEAEAAERERRQRPAAPVKRTIPRRRQLGK